jgi:hypothetical protein
MGLVLEGRISRRLLPINLRSSAESYALKQIGKPWLADFTPRIAPYPHGI